MSSNGKTKTGKTAANQDYMNLLYSNSDSESDVVPDLKLPPLKGKKQRRRKHTSNREQEPFCTVWTVIKIIVAVCGLVSIIVLTGLSYWSLLRLKELEHQVASLQAIDKVPSDILKLLNQVNQLNKTLHELQIDVDKFNKTLNEMSIKIDLVLTKNLELEKSISTSTQYVNAPKQLQELASSVAALGSDQTNKNLDFEKKLKELEESIKKVNPSENGNANDQLIKQQLAGLQKMVETTMSNVTKDLNLQASKLSSLETLVQSLPLSTQDNSSGNVDKAPKLSEQVAATLEDLKKMYLSSNMTERGDFLAFQQETLSNTKNINQTLYTLNNEFDALNKRLEVMDDAVLNITHTMDTYIKDNKQNRLFNETEATN